MNQDAVRETRKSADRKWLSVLETAERLGVSSSLVYQWCQEKRLPHLRLGKAGRRGKILIAGADLETFLEGLKVAAGAGVVPAPALRHITPR